MIVGSQSCIGMVSMNNRELSYTQWAEKIDEAKKREAYGDLSVIAYSLLNLLLSYAFTTKGKK